jgi:uncharacterized protein YdaU (DUF1376 family)
MKDPAFLFYPNDYLGGTMGMTFEEKGAYIELLMLQFNRGHMTSHMIGQTVGQIWDKIQDKFIKDENGKYYNVRLEEEQNKRKTFTESRRNNILGSNQYTKKTGHKIGHMTSHMENENVIENIDVFKKNVFCFSEKYPEEMLNKFFEYWTLPFSNGKMRFENQKTFDIAKRLYNWNKNERPKLDLSKFNQYEKQIVEKWIDYLAKNNKFLIQDSIDEIRKTIDRAGGVPEFRELVEKSIQNGWRGLFPDKEPKFKAKY